jgi:hypothetical protein
LFAAQAKAKKDLISSELQREQQRLCKGFMMGYANAYLLKGKG